MSEVLKALFQRRSVRQYTGEPIAEERMDQILQAALVSESARNQKAYELIVVRDRERLRQMAGCRAYGGRHLAEADAAIVVVGRTDSDTWVEDCVIAMANMHLTADSLGVGSCFIQGRMRLAQDSRSTDDFLRELLGYPEQLQLEGILCLGMPASHPAAYTETDLPYEKIHVERY
ncbi:MAG: nitroreductase [Ruminococcaceae bacterium]|nr:nitroreductase [Oscillospiraceae bacterium]